MNIEGLHYENPATWKRVREQLQWASVEALPKIVGETLTRHAKGPPCTADDPPGKMETLEALCKGLLDSKHGFAVEVLKALEPRRMRLSRTTVAGARDVNLFDLISDLVTALISIRPGKTPVVEGVPKYIGQMARRLSKITRADSPDQYATVAFETFEALRGELSLEHIRVQFGMGDSVDWLERKLRLVDAVQNECLRFLRSWTNHPKLAALVVGQSLDSGTEDLQLRRCLRHERVSAEWLIRFDTHYVAIRTELARLAGSPLTARAAAALKPPLSSKRRDTIVCEEGPIQRLLDQLARMREERQVSTADIDMVAALQRLPRQLSDEGACLQPDPRLLGLDGEPASAGEAPDDDAAPPDSESSADTDDNDDADADSDDRLVVVDAAEGHVRRLSWADVAESLPDPKVSERQNRSDAAESEPAQPTTATVVAPCLEPIPLPLRVALIRKLASTLKDQPDFNGILLELLDHYEEQGVFATLRCKPSLQALTDTFLATCLKRLDGNTGVPVAAFKTARDKALARFMDCARERFRNLSPGPRGL